jgi:bifunctional non-homologous end joining protein LigD
VSSANSSDPDPLERYRDKRRASATPEPFGSGREGSASRPAGAGIFVVHQHDATRLHWDLRLEIDGVLVSWAVPHGPSMNPDEKRLAVKVENNPLEYASFEGVIPEGNYGAGSVIIWDRGLWTPLIDPVEALKGGEIKMELRGYKLRGAFTLVLTQRPRERGASDQWLLIKKRDAHATDAPLPAESILSGLTVHELREAPKRGEAIARDVAAAGAQRRVLDRAKLKPMLCQTAEEPFSHPDWLYELKYDGYRLLTWLDGGRAALRYRSGLDATDRFPDIAAAVQALPFSSLVLDGEVVVFDDAGRPTFNLLQQRTQLLRSSDIRRAAVALPATYVVFDLLGFAGWDLRHLPLRVRKELLRRVLPRTGPLRYADHVEGLGLEMYRGVADLGLEGVIAKRADTAYKGARSEHWLKFRVDRVGDFAVVGYSPPKNSRIAFGALHLGVCEGDRWTYAGKVGSGFTDRELVELMATMAAIPTWKPHFPKPEGEAGSTWIEPRLVVTVKYNEWPAGSVIRFPVFLHLRHDKRPDECTLAQLGVVRGPNAVSGHADAPEEGDETAAVVVDPAPRELKLSNQKKVFWPDDGYTKGDLIEYYRAVAPWLLPHLEDRPVVLTRFPDGIGGKSFFQKDAPDWVPPWIRTERMWSEHAEREIHYFICEHADSLAYVANMASIPLHVWCSRVASIQRPDWCVIDLDPKGAPFKDVVACAWAVRALCESIRLPTYVKTTGSTGLHILIPLGGQCTYDQSRTMAYLLSLIVERALPAISTTNRNVDERGGRVYLDWGQNGHGRLIVGPYSVRPLPKAPVSMPIRWDEVVPDLDLTTFNIRTAIPRLEAMGPGGDPLLPVLREKPDLVAALALLTEKVAGEKT